MGDEALRINRFLASAGCGSRRSCEELVRQGRVVVNGSTVTDLALRVHPGDTVSVDGATVNAARKQVYIVLNKPAGVISSNSDDRGRTTALSLVREMHGGHLFSVGRLDLQSTGLLLYTNDGETAQRLMHPSRGIQREYIVETQEPIPDAVLAAFRTGIRVQGEEYRALHYRRHGERRVNIVLSEGKNREIRRVFEHFRIRVSRIHRVKYGPVSLGRLPVGQARFLTEKEIRDLKRETARETPPRSAAKRRTPPRRTTARRKSTGDKRGRSH